MTEHTGSVATVDRVLPWRRHSAPPSQEIAPARRRVPRAPPPGVDRHDQPGLRAGPRRPRRPDPQVGRALRHPPGGGGQDRGRAGPRRHHRLGRPAARRGRGHGRHPGRPHRRVRARRGRHRRRRHQARPAQVRLQGGPAGRHHAQDAGGDGQGPAGPDHQAVRPAAQHAHHRGHAGLEAGAHRPGDARHLRPAGPPPGHAGDEAAARGPGLRRPAPQALRRDRPHGGHPLARARDLPDPGARGRARAAATSCASPPR